MPKEFSKVVNICQIVSKYSIYVLVALMPVLFLPITSDVLDFNKQTLLIFLVFLSLIAQMIKILVSGKLDISLNKTHISVVVLFIVYLIATIFSQDKYGSFWGWPRITSESLLTLIGFSLLYFIVSNFLSKKEIFVSIVVLLFSSIASTLFAILQLFGLFLLPFDFTKSSNFNTIGSVSILGMFLSLILPILVVFVITIKEKWLKIVFGVGIVLSAVCLFLINYYLVWWFLLISSALFIVFGMFKKDLFDLRWLSVPIFFFVLALFFITVNPLIILPEKQLEIYLNQEYSLDVALKTIKEKPILGSGPGTFIYNFLKYKKQDFNQSQFWNTGFDYGASKILTNLSTTGILGVFALFVLMVTIIFYGVMFFVKDSFLKIKNTNKDSAFLIVAMGIFVVILSQTIYYFIYRSGFVLDFLYFFLISCFVALISERKEQELSPSSFITLGVTLVFTLIFIFGLGLTILQGQRYFADVNFNLGLKAFLNSQSEKGLSYFEKAVTLNSNSDFYLTNLSQVYLSESQKLINKQDITEEEKNKLQILISNAINVSKIATDINPKNISNWSNRGFIYQNLLGIMPGADDWAIKSYEEASLLDPQNPYYITQKGIVYLVKAKQSSEQKDTKEQENSLNLAKQHFDKAIELKSDYASARFQLAMVFQEQGKTEQVIPSLLETKKYAPNDVGLSFQIGLLYYQKKDYKNAQIELERTISLNPKYANGLYFLGLTYSAQGQNSKAIDVIKKVQELNPENQEVKKVLENLQSGKDPLFGISQENIPQEPIKEESSDKKDN